MSTDTLSLEHSSESALKSTCAVASTPFPSHIYIVLDIKKNQLISELFLEESSLTLNMHKGAAFTDSLNSGCYLQVSQGVQ